MSTNHGEPDPQEWPTYPGMPVDPGQPSAHPRPSGPLGASPDGQRPYAEPDAHADEAYRAYQDYARSRSPREHQQLRPYGQAPYQRQPANDPSTWLQNKWTWIIGGIVAVFVITGIASGEFPFGVLIFAFVVWQILKHRRNR